MSPPIPVVPFVVIIAEDRVFLAGPGFAPLNMTSPLKLSTRYGRIGLAWQIKVLWTKQIPTFPWARGRRGLRCTIGNYRSNISGFLCKTVMLSSSCSRYARETEGVRFELTRPFGLPVFKTGAINRSATPPGNGRATSNVQRPTSNAECRKLLSVQGLSFGVSAF